MLRRISILCLKTILILKEKKLLSSRIKKIMILILKNKM